MIKLDIYFEYPGQLQIVREAGHLVPQHLPGQALGEPGQRCSQIY